MGGANTGKKGILKKPGSKVLSDSEDEGRQKRGITFGKEQIHKINRADEEDDYSGEKAKGSPRVDKPEERDISDGRTEKERVRDKIMEKQKREAAEVKATLAKQRELAEEDESISASQSKFSKMSKLFKSTVEESIGESSSMSVSANKKREDSPEKEDYSEDFEDASGSGSMNHAAKFEAARKKAIEDTYESSYS